MELYCRAWADPIPFSLPENCPDKKMSSLPCLKELPDPNKLIQVDELDNVEMVTPPSASDRKGKGLASSEISSPGTPLEQLQNKVISSSGPWSKVLLEKAQKNDLDELLEDLAVRRSKRMEVQKKGFQNIACTRKN